MYKYGLYVKKHLRLVIAYTTEITECLKMSMKYGQYDIFKYFIDHRKEPRYS